MNVTIKELKTIRRIMLDLGAGGDLGGWCAISSYAIVRAIVSRKGLAKVHGNCFHCFTEHNGFFIDVSASQFRADVHPIYVSPQPLVIDNGFNLPIHLSECAVVFKPGKVGAANRALASFLEKWPEEQDPFRNVCLFRAICFKLRSELGIDIRGQFC